MKKLSELNDALLLFSDKNNKLVTVGMLHEDIENGVEAQGKYHTVKTKNEGFTLVDEIEIDVVNQ